MHKNLSYIGLGLILAKIRFDVSLERQRNGHGWRCNRRIRFLNLNHNQRLAMEIWAEEHDLKLNKNGIKDIEKWILALDAYEYLIQNQKGLMRMKYVIDNPMPVSKQGSTWEEFVLWAKAWDEYNASLDSNLI